VYIKICYNNFEVDKMHSRDDQLKEKKQTYKQKEKEEQKPNAIETGILDILRSKKNEQKLWLSLQDIVDGFQNKALLIDYWTKSSEFKTDLLKALIALEEKGKIEKKVFAEESYFSNVF
jgi:hypothetical protein